MVKIVKQDFEENKRRYNKLVKNKITKWSSNYSYRFNSNS